MVGFGGLRALHCSFCLSKWGCVLSKNWPHLKSLSYLSAIHSPSKQNKMTDFNESNRIADPASVSVWPTAFRYGGLVALALVVIGLVMYLAGMSDPANPSSAQQVVSCLNYIIIMGAVVFAIKAHRDNDLGGYITLGRSMGVGTATALIIGVISAVWTVIFMTLIFPDMADAIKDAALEKAQPGQEEMTEKMVGIFSNPFIVSIMVLGGTVLIGFITSLIAGAIMKKDPAPNV
jgi:Protein of unknown function (DUF4199)